MNLGSMFPTWLRVISSPNESDVSVKKDEAPKRPSGTALCGVSLQL